MWPLVVAPSVCAPSVASVFAHVVDFNPLFAQFLLRQIKSTANISSHLIVVCKSLPASFLHIPRIPRCCKLIAVQHCSMGTGLPSPHRTGNSPQECYLAVPPAAAISDHPRRSSYRAVAIKVNSAAGCRQSQLVNARDVARNVR